MKFLLVPICCLTILLFGRNIITENFSSRISQKSWVTVEPEEAEGMYQELTQNCTGALVWNLEVGDKIAITDLSTTEACKNEDYYSKMIGYTYNDLGVVLHVNVLKRTGNSVYKLDDTYVGEYDENNIDTLLESGTTYEYTFVQKEDRYELTEVSLMPVE